MEARWHVTPLGTPLFSFGPAYAMAIESIQDPLMQNSPVDLCTKGRFVLDVYVYVYAGSLVLYDIGIE